MLRSRPPLRSTHPRPSPLVTALAGALLVIGASRAYGAEPPAREAIEQFERDVRPVLIAACHGCHGSKKQEGGLRTDGRTALLRGGDSGPAIEPGAAGRSLLIAAVERKGELKMPPDKPLTAAQIAALRSWIDAGAAWPEEAPVATVRGGPITDDERKHWAFQPLRRAELPALADPAWSDTEVDRFVRRNLDARALEPAPVADRRTLLRRMRLAITGLPPEPEETADFLADENPDALHRLVDRLLADPAQGERWGRHWLDVVRYADTAGDGADYPIREAYLYRNYVIRSLAADKPYDQFVREQLAGDLLAQELDANGQATPERYAELITATGYLAVAKRFGYNVNTEFQHLDMADVIEGFGRSLLGLSLGCARCHDHKYDPLNMADYYSLYGIFASSRFSFPGGEEHKRPAFLVPLAPPRDVEAAERRKQQQTAELQRQIDELERGRAVEAAKLPPDGGALAFESQKLAAPPAAPWFHAGPNQVLAAAQSPFTNTYPAGSRGLRMNVGLPNDGLRWTLAAPVSAAAAGRLEFNLDFRNLPAANPEPGAYRFYLGQGAIQSLAIEIGVNGRELAIRNGDAWETLAPIVPDAWYNLRLSVDLAKKRYQGRLTRSGEKEGVVEFTDKACHPNWNGMIDTFFCDGIGHSPGARPVHDVDNLALQTSPIVAPSAAPLAPAEAARLAAEIARFDARIADVRKQIESLNKQPAASVAYGVAEGEPKNVRIQKRGEPDRPGDEAPRRNLEILGGEPLPADRATRSSGRRELAEWVVRRENPLTPRVIANRIWQQLFGAGIVPTESDFGLRGDPPSDQALLDRLAVRLVESDGSLKRLQRELVLSRAWRSAADGPAASQAADPTNVWCWKHSRRPLDAESLRDGLLWASGELNRAMAGPHPFPPVESWGFTIHYPFHAEYDSSHRSVYLMLQRQRKQPYLSLFDGADPNLSTARRLPTTTPLQALYLMNSDFVHRRSEAAGRRFAAPASAATQNTAPQNSETSALAAADETLRLRAAFDAWLCQAATDDELSAARDFLARYRAQAVRSGMGADAAERAAWSGLARVLLTSNAFLFVE